MSNDDALERRRSARPRDARRRAGLAAAAARRATGSMIESEIADMKNIGGGYGGAIAAGRSSRSSSATCRGSTSTSPAPPEPTRRRRPRPGRHRLRRPHLRRAREHLHEAARRAEPTTRSPEGRLTPLVLRGSEPRTGVRDPPRPPRSLAHTTHASSRGRSSRSCSSWSCSSSSGCGGRSPPASPGPTGAIAVRVVGGRRIPGVLILGALTATVRVTLALADAQRLPLLPAADARHRGRRRGVPSVPSPRRPLAERLAADFCPLPSALRPPGRPAVLPPHLVALGRMTTGERGGDAVAAPEPVLHVPSCCRSRHLVGDHRRRDRALDLVVPAVDEPARSAAVAGRGGPGNNVSRAAARAP